jgi:hypothetical protein
MTVLRLREAAEETGMGKSTMWRAIESDCMSTELIEDGGAPNASLRQLPAPGTIATGDLAAKLADADAAISTIQKLLGEVRTNHDELRRTWTTSSGIATSGAGGPSGLQNGRGGGGSQAEIQTSSTARRPCASNSAPLRIESPRLSRLLFSRASSRS